MKRLLKITCITVMLAAMLASVSIVFSADTYNGWRMDEDGVERYYQNGEFVTGAYEINGFPYEFNSSGEYVGVYDGHVGVGVTNVPSTEEYKAALKALGSSNIIGYYSMNEGESYKNASFSKLWELGAQNPNPSRKQADSNVYTSNDIFTSVDRHSYLTEIQRYTSNEIVERGAGDRAILVKGSTTGGNSGDSLHTYVSAITKSAIAGEATVIEAEFKLDEDYSHANKLLQLIDRKNTDTNGDVFIDVLQVNAEGGVYLSNDKNNFICVLNKNAYTRISVVIHPSGNTMDFYVNGLLVKSGVEYVPSSKAYKPANLQLEEIRLTQISAQNGGGMFIDNVAIYRASAPVCVNDSNTKSGVYPEGGVLRYYQNNLIAIGVHEISGEFLGVKYDKERVNFGTINGNGGVAIGYTATVKVNGAVKTAERVEGNIFVAPDAIELEGEKFIGWSVTDGEKRTVVAPGQRYYMSGDIVCEPKTIGFSMLDGASIRTTEGSTDIRFMAKVSKEDYRYITENGATVKTHIVIAPTEYFEKTYGYYTADALTKAGYTDFVDIEVGEWYAENENSYYFAGSIANISPDRFARDYSGLAYLEVTYADGSKLDVYADYSLEDNSRSVYRVAHAAYNDRTTMVGQSNYPNLVKYLGADTYSPYDDSKRAIIKSFADRVIMLSTDKSSVRVAGSFYDAPYAVHSSFNEATLKTDVTVSPGTRWSASTVCAVEVDGVRLSAEEYSLSDNCSFSLDIGGVDFSSLKDTSEGEHSKLFLDADKDYRSFSGFSLNTDSNYCYGGAGSSIEWAYATTIRVENKPDSGKTLGEYSAVYNSDDGRYYYDLSDIQTFTFYVYSTESATFHFNIYSENEQTEGSDYYGKKLTLASGWNSFTVQRNALSFNRTPLGWDKVTSVELTGSGWDQSNSTNTVLYISDIVAHDRVIKTNGFKLPELESAAVFALGGYYSAVNCEKYKTSATDMNATVTELDGVYYIPMAPLADFVGMKGRYYPSSDTLYAERDGVSYVYNVGSKKYTVGGKTEMLQYSPIEVSDAILFSVQDMMAAFGYTQLYTDRMGLIILSNTEAIYDHDIDYDKIYSLVEECIYVRPSGERIIEDLTSASGGAHPYLMIDQDGFERLRYYYVMDATFRQYFDKLEKDYAPGSKNFNAETTDFILTDGKRLTRNVKDRTIYWAFFAKFYETIDPELSETYAERCWIEVESGCNFTDPERGVKSWNPFHYLDTAEMAYPIAIAYDWLYDYWVKTNDNVKTEYNADNSKTSKNYKYGGTETRLSVMEDSLYWLGLATTGILPSDDTGEYVSYGYALQNATNNWNAVCTGGVMAAGLALAGVERYADNVETFLEYAVGAIESGMWVYAPDGGYEEGPGYWTYGTTYLHVFLSGIDTACGTNYGIYNAPGFAHSVYFTTYMGAKNTTWGFHDGGSGSADTGIAPWFAMKAQDANVNAIRRQALENGWKSLSFYDILYFDPHLCSNTITLETDAYYSLDDIMTFRTSWNADDSIFAGLHGGDNTASHGDLDIGNFVINANGTFMICELGKDNYNTEGYFGTNRWSYYRKRAEGQNTLVMRPHGTSWNGTTGNPQAGIEPITDQIATAISKVQRFESGINSALGVIDMAPAYNEMKKGVRGLYMDKVNNTVIIQDEATFSKTMDIWWFAHTEGKITVSEDGKSAVIERNGVYLYAEIISANSAYAKFTAMKANSLDKNYVGDTSTNDKYNSANVELSRDGISKLCVKIANVKELRLAIAFTVIPTADAVPQRGTIYAWKSIDEWKVD